MAGPVESIADIAQQLAEKGTPSDIRLSNVVITCNVSCRLDLHLIAKLARNVEYNPKRWGAAVMRIRDPKATAMIWNSGKIVCLGCRTVADGQLACRKFARKLRALGFQAAPGDFAIQNMVASIDTKSVLRLEGIAYEHSAFASFEPEIFAGLTYRILSPRVTLVMFCNGKIIFTGAKTEQHIWEAWEKVYPVVLGESRPHNSFTSHLQFQNMA